MEDQWILSRLNTVVREVTENMEKYELGIAVQKVYDFLWMSSATGTLRWQRFVCGRQRKIQRQPERLCGHFVQFLPKV